MNDNHNILIVDDNLINRKYFSMSLIKTGFNVETAENGRQAIELAKSIKFDAILMDIRMPDLNGFETSKIIQNLSANSNTPIIATSAEKLSQNEKSMFSDFLLKPITPKALAAKIQTHCNRSEKSVFNEKQAYEFAYNDKEIMHKLISMFVLDLPIQANLIRQLIIVEDYKETKQLIHKLRGSCKTCGATALDRALITLNASLTNGNIKKIESDLTIVLKQQKDYLKFINKIIN